MIFIVASLQSRAFNTSYHLTVAALFWSASAGARSCCRVSDLTQWARWLNADAVTSPQSVSWPLHQQGEPLPSGDITTSARPSSIGSEGSDTWDRRRCSGRSGVGRRSAAEQYLLTYLFSYLFALPVMAGVHGCGFWEAGAAPSTTRLLGMDSSSRADPQAGPHTHCAPDRMLCARGEE